MSGLIEQAARRLEQLREAGVEIPDTPPARIPLGTHESAPLQRVPVDQVRALEQPAHTSRHIALDIPALAAAGIITPNAPRSRLADQYRVIKRPLIRNATGKGAAVLKHGNLIMVTSALAGEGKSFTAVNLAMSIAAERDHTVMLV
ncbi:MAG: chromosome partitioning ATPase, partial [Caldimonas sp.]